MLGKMVEFCVKKQFIYDLPIEIINNIILRAGGVQLIILISKKLTESCKNIIIEHNLIIKSIDITEINDYLSSKPKIIYAFHYHKDRMFACGHGANRNYECYEITDFCNQISYISGSRTYEHHEKLCTIANCTVKQFIIDYQVANYDLLTIFNIMIERTGNKQLAKKVCIDTLNYHCKILKNERLWIYLYSNLLIYDTFYQFISPVRYDEQIVHNGKYHLLEKLNELCDDVEELEEYYHYSSYAIHKI